MWSPSPKLQQQLMDLTPKRRQAILRIIQAEIDGVALTRLLKTTYSCQWCGLVVGQSGERRDDRKAKLAEHEERCERHGKPWSFICRLTTYYRKWIKDEAFAGALEAARADVTVHAMQQAATILQTGTPEAALELRRQIAQGEKDTDRRLSAVALLDRAGIETAVKQVVVSEQGGTDNVDYGDYADAPVAFSEEHLGSRLTAGQVEVLEAVRDHKITVVKSANAVGKTYVGADLALWFLRAHRRSEVYLSAAPPLENLERLLWGELERRLSDHPGPFREAKTGYLNVELGPSWWINGVAIPSSGTSAQREAKFSGKHAPHLMFIIDEGDAVPDEVYRGIDSCMSGGHARLVVFFNPREGSGPVYQLIRAGAHVVTLDAFSHPNVTTGRTVVPGAVSREQVVERISKWSRPATEDELENVGKLEKNSEWFQVPAFLDGCATEREDGTEYPPLIGGQWRKVTNPALSYMVLARFPGQSENQLISRAWVEAAQQRWLVWQQEHGDEPPDGIRPNHGQDVAELGQDRNAACFRYGGWVAPFVTWGGVDALVSGDRAAELAMEHDARESYVDATGVGAGVWPQMKRWWTRHGWRDGVARRIMVSEKPTVKAEEGEFKALRDQLWWLCREWLRTDPGAMLPPDEDLADELCAVHYRVKNGKIQVDNKDTLRDTLRRSPDKADALCLTFADSVPRYAPTAYEGRSKE